MTSPNEQGYFRDRRSNPWSFVDGASSFVVPTTIEVPAPSTNLTKALHDSADSVHEKSAFKPQIIHRPLLSILTSCPAWMDSRAVRQAGMRGRRSLRRLDFARKTTMAIFRSIRFCWYSIP